MSTLARKDLTRFWEKVDTRGGPTACWPWLAAHRPAGYGQFKLDGWMRDAHRVSYEINVGPLEDGKYICHHCDNPPCVNPAHLFQGTPSDNAVDRERKGRRVAPRGEAHGQSKLTEPEVVEIKAALGAGATRLSLARAYGVSWRSIELIRRGETWSHV